MYNIKLTFDIQLPEIDEWIILYSWRSTVVAIRNWRHDTRVVCKQRYHWLNKNILPLKFNFTKIFFSSCLLLSRAYHLFFNNNNNNNNNSLLDKAQQITMSNPCSHTMTIQVYKYNMRINIKKWFNYSSNNTIQMTYYKVKPF